MLPATSSTQWDAEDYYAAELAAVTTYSALLAEALAEHDSPIVPAPTDTGDDGHDAAVEAYEQRVSYADWLS